MRSASVSGNSRLKHSRIQRWQKSSWRPSSPSLSRCWWKRGSMRRSSSRRYICTGSERVQSQGKTGPTGTFFFFYTCDQSGSTKTETADSARPKPHAGASYQLSLHIFVARRADEDGVLHEADEAPEGVAFILDLSEQGGHQVRHALAVAHVRVKHSVVEQNPPGERPRPLSTLRRCSSPSTHRTNTNT